MAPDGPVQHLGHPGVALDQRRRDRVGPRIGTPVRPGDQGRDRGLGGVDLAEGGQHVGDVGQEAVVRADDQHAGPGQLVAEGVQQVRRPVQPDRGLAGARCALDAQRLGQAGPDDGVLLRLDGGHDVAHRPGAWALDLRLEDVGVRPVGVAAVRSSSSYAVSRPCAKPNRRRRRTPIGSPGRAR